MKQLFENWRKHLNEQELPPGVEIAEPNPFGELISTFNRITTPDGLEIGTRLSAQMQWGQGVPEPYVYIMDHERGDKSIARFKTPESFKNAIEQAPEAFEVDENPYDQIMNYGELLKHLSDN